MILTFLRDIDGIVARKSGDSIEYEPWDFEWQGISELDRIKMGLYVQCFGQGEFEILVVDRDVSVSTSDDVITMDEVRLIIAGLISQYPDDEMSTIKAVSFACVEYVYLARINDGDDQNCTDMLDGKMPSYSILDGVIELDFGGCGD